MVAFSQALWKWLLVYGKRLEAGMLAKGTMVPSAGLHPTNPSPYKLPREQRPPCRDTPPAFLAARCTV